MLYQFRILQYLNQLSLICSIFIIGLFALPSPYDHVSHHRKTLNWLSIASLMQYHSLCAMYQRYHSSHSVLLDPPIVFGSQCMHCTRCPEHFTNLDRCRLSLHPILCFTLVEFTSRSCCFINSKSIHLHGTCITIFCIMTIFM